MASGTFRSRRQRSFAHDAILVPLDDDPVLPVLDELAGDWLAPDLDPHYADLPCYVPLIDDEGLEPFALDVPLHEGASVRLRRDDQTRPAEQPFERRYFITAQACRSPASPAGWLL